MRIMKHIIGKQLSKNKKGNVEGLPLQLMIIILVAAMGTAILVGWMGGIETPNSIGSVDVVSGDIILDNNSTSDGIVELYVTDNNGNPLDGATVILSGLGITDNKGKTAYLTTNDEGYASFEDLRITLRGSDIGFITVNVSMPDYGEKNSTRIAVIA